MAPQPAAADAPGAPAFSGVRRGAAGAAYAWLRQAILAGALPPGSPLSENEVASRLGVSRTPVREAIIRLEGEGLLVVRPQVGTTVAAIDLDAVADGQFLREAVECRAVALAAGRIDAFFATIHAPAREIGRLAARTKLALVPIGPSRDLVEGGLVPLTLPALTYAGQTTPVPTLAATALLLTRADVAPAAVEAMLGLLFEHREGSATAAVAQVGVARALGGVAIPLHPAAQTWLAAHGARAPASASR